MATDGASCEPDFSRAPEEAAGAPAEAAVTEVPGWARGTGMGAFGALRKPRLFRVPFPPGVPSWGASSPEAGARRPPGLGIPPAPS